MTEYERAQGILDRLMQDPEEGATRVHRIMAVLLEDKRERDAALAAVARLKRVIEADRTNICDGINVVDKTIASRSWLCEGRGSYEWDDDRYRQEFGAALTAIHSSLGPLREIAANLADSPQTTEEVMAARGIVDRRLREALDDGKHIIADILHGVVYEPAELQRWVNEAEEVYFAAGRNAGSKTKV